MTYAVSPVPSTVEELPRWLHQEMTLIAATLDIALARQVEFLNVAPAKPREGDVRGADGTNWNPGAGKGVYVYYTAAWHLLG